MQVLAVIGSLLLVHLATAQYEVTPGEVAEYNVIRTGDGFEEREYPAKPWVCHTNMGKPGASRAMRNSFFPLFRYITGNNEQAAEIAMTAPVTMLTETEPKEDEVMFQMCFYVPADHQRNPPQPVDPEVYIENRPVTTVMVRRFGGYVWKPSQWALQAKLLKESLQAAGETNIDYTKFYGVGYDAPMKLKDRRNEVWYVMA